MSKEEDLLEKWRSSIPKNSVLCNDYSIDGQNVRLTTTRVLNETDPGKSIYIDCLLNCESINTAIEELSENRNKLI